MAQVPIGLRLDEDLLARIDAAREDVPRARWIGRAIEQRLRRQPDLDSVVDHAPATRHPRSGNYVQRPAPDVRAHAANCKCPVCS